MNVGRVAQADEHSAIGLFGAPIYVRHEVVHNVHVVDRLRRTKGIEVHLCATNVETGSQLIQLDTGRDMSIPQARTVEM